MSDERFRGMLDAMPHIVWVMRADGSYSYFNEKWLAYTGLSLPDSLQRGWPQAVHTDDRARIARLSKQAMANRQTGESECRLRCTDGSYRWM